MCTTQIRPAWSHGQSQYGLDDMLPDFRVIAISVVATIMIMMLGFGLFAALRIANQASAKLLARGETPLARVFPETAPAPPRVQTSIPPLEVRADPRARHPNRGIGDAGQNLARNRGASRRSPGGARCGSGRFGRALEHPRSADKSGGRERDRLDLCRNRSAGRRDRKQACRYRPCGRAPIVAQHATAARRPGCAADDHKQRFAKAGDHECCSAREAGCPHRTSSQAPRATSGARAR